MAITWSTGVSGRTPWPRLKICPGTAAGAAQDFCHSAFDFFRRSEQRDRIEVALDGDVVADGGPAFVKIDTPVQADDIAAGGADVLQQTGGAGAEVDHRHTGNDRVDNRFGVGLNKLLVVRWRQTAGPAIEDLHGLGAGGDLAIQIFADRVSPAVPSSASTLPERHKKVSWCACSCASRCLRSSRMPE